MVQTPVAQWSTVVYHLYIKWRGIQCVEGGKGAVTTSLARQGLSERLRLRKTYDWWRRKVKVSRSILSSSLGSHELDRLSCQDPLPMGFSWQEYGVSYHFLLQGSSLPRDWTWVSCTAGRLFTVWVTREAREGVNHTTISERAL